MRRQPQLEDAGDDPVEEGPVVGHGHDRARRRRHERLEEIEPGEVQVVRRLVQQQDVLAGEQDGSQRGTGRLAAGEVADLDVEAVGGQADLIEHGARAGVDVTAPDGQEVLERRRVGLDRVGLTGHRRGGAVQLGLCVSDAGPPGQIGPQGLPRWASGSWGSQPTVAVAGERSTTPPSGTSAPARMRSRVDLPIPLGPTTPRRVPGVIESDTPPSTTCEPWWRTRSLATSTSADATGGRAGNGQPIQ